jgi:hypothetical protein
MKKSKIEITLELIMLGVFLVAVAISFSIDHFNAEEQRDIFDKEYPTLKYSDPLNEIILSVFDWGSIGWRSSGHISLVKTTGNNYEIKASEIKNNGDLGIDEIISVGDSIYKRRNSDTIIITTNSKEKFVLLRRD